MDFVYRSVVPQSKVKFISVVIISQIQEKIKHEQSLKPFVIAVCVKESVRL